jgi:hypothetical protein
MAPGRTLIVLLGLAALLAADPALGAEPITKPESRSLPEKSVQSRVLSQLRDILVPTARFKPYKPAERPLSDIWYWTTPVAGNEDGVCRSNLIRFEFAPTDRRDRGAETPVKVIGLTADWRYRFAEAGRACGDLSPEALDFVDAPSEDAFVRGHAALVALKAAIADGSPVELSCGRRTPGECRDMILKSEVGAVDEYQDCEARPGDPTGWSCEAISFGDYRLRTYGPYRTPPEVRAVELTEYIVLWHERRD